MKNKLFVSLFAFTVSLLYSCNKGEIIYNTDTEGELCLSLSADVAEVVVSKSDTESDNNDATEYADGENINEYAILITKDSVAYAGFDTFADLPEGNTIKLMNGTGYNIKAYWGADYPIAFESPYYEGNQDFTIVGYETTTIDLVCKLANTKLSIVYSDSFKAAVEDNFSSFRVEVTTDYTDSPLDFYSFETRSAYFKSSPFVITVWLTKSDGRYYYYSFPAVEDVEPGYSYVVTLRGVGYNDPEGSITIDINNTTTDVITTEKVAATELIENLMSVELSTSVVSGVSFVEGFAEGNVPTILAYVKAEAGLKDIVIKSESNAFANYTDGVSMAKVDTDASYAMSVQSDLGLVPETDALAGQTGYRIDFNDMLDKFECVNDFIEAHTIQIEGTDVLDKTAINEFTVYSKKAGVNYTHPKDLIWGGKAYLLPITSDSLVSKEKYKSEIMESLTYQYKKESDSDDSWAEYVPVTDDHCLVSGLTAGTNYTTRILYDGQYELGTSSFTTEPAEQLSNGGLDTWTNNEPSDWTTNNAEITTANGSYALYRQDGVRKITGRTSYAAEVAVIGMGNVTTTTFLFTKTAKPSIQKVMSGVLTYSKELASRPTSVQYYYKLSTYNSKSYSVSVNVKSGDTIIGTASLSNSTSKTSYTLSTLTIDYGTNIDLPATHIEIVFTAAMGTMTTSDVDASASDSYNSLFGSLDEEALLSEGNVLTIDDITLVY